MASLDARKGHQSPRPKGRENAKNILCRNMTIYGSCRAQNNGCPYSHDVSRFEANNDNSKRFLSVDSPSFTPLAPVTNTQNAKIGISPKAAAAAIFTPRSSAPTPVPIASQKTPPSNEWTGGIREFIPSGFNDFPPSSTPGFDPYSMQAVSNNMSDMQEPSQSAQLNPYAQDQAPMFQNPAAFPSAHPLNYHLYAPIGPHRENLMAYQRTAHDFFIPDHLREELQRKTEATLQTFSNSTLPLQLEHFHSLVALDTTVQKVSSVYGYSSWLYKAVSSKDGYTYCLRRLENFRLTDERAIRTVQKWKRISNGNVVIVHDAFTTRAFGDSSLIIVTDYHPLSQTMAEKHFGQAMRHPTSRAATGMVPDHELWGYIVQLASALKAIHSGGLAARLLVPQKVLLTSKNRLRLNSCGILDITQFEQQRPIPDLQSEDLVHLGRLILGIATKSQVPAHGPPKGLDQIARIYGEKMRDTITWLLTPPMNAAAAELSGDRNIDTFLSMISSQVISTFDAALHEADSLTSNLARELENARLVRLFGKLNCILERPESTPAGAQPPQGPASLNLSSSAWSETGERYYLKLFRDYVFHQVDADGRPVLDLGRMLACLNKLDAGIEEKIMLISRDEQNCFIVSYRELKRSFESAWNELVKGAAGRR